MSPRRIELLRGLPYDFEVIPSAAAEAQDEALTPRELAQLNAYRKARLVAKRFPDALVLGADTVVCLGTKCLGKPADRPEAVRMLAELSGRTHEVITGVCLVHLREHRQKLFAEGTEVTFRDLKPAVIEEYLSSINPLDKAGAYAIQEGGDRLVGEIFGSYTNVIGLPMERVREELEAWRNERGFFHS